MPQIHMRLQEVEHGARARGQAVGLAQVDGVDGFQVARVEFLQHGHQPAGEHVGPGVVQRQAGQARAVQRQLAHHIAAVDAHHLPDIDGHALAVHQKRPVRYGALVAPAQAHMVAQLVWMQGPAHAGQVLRRGQDDLPRVAQQPRHHVRGRKLAPAHGDVRAGLDQVHDLVREAQFQAQPGMALKQLRHQGHEQHFSGR